MKSQHVLFVVPSNNDILFNSLWPSSSNLKPVHEVLHQVSDISSVRVNQIISSPTSALPTRLIIMRAPSTNFSNPVSLEILNKSVDSASFLEKQTNSSPYDLSVPESNFIEIFSPADRYR